MFLIRFLKTKFSNPKGDIKEDSEMILHEPLRCRVCNFIIKEIMKLGEGETKKGIKKLLKHVCRLIPAPLGTVCEGSVHMIGGFILEEIDRKIPLNKICSLYKRCTLSYENPFTPYLYLQH